jgi:transcriptional regulator with XRE-family HTH domain
MPKSDYTRLRQRIRSLRLTQQSISKAIGLSESHFCHKLQGKYAFNEREIRQLCWLLNIPQAEIGSYFFCYEVEETQQQTDEEEAT